MALRILQRQLAERPMQSFCDKRVPAKYKNKIRLYFKIRGNSVTLVDSRLDIFGANEWLDLSIAQFRYDESKGIWILYYADRNDKWHIYVDFDSSKNLEHLIKEVDDDPTGIFFG
jgi:hypothetical protein